MRRGKRFTVLLLLAATLLPAEAVTAAAAEKPETIDEEQWARLQDNLLEYDEIENLIVCYNPVYRQVNNAIQPNIDALEKAAEDYRNDAWLASRDAETAKEKGDVVDQMILEMTASGEREAVKAMNRAADSAKRASNQGLDQVRKQLTGGVQQMIFGYWQVMNSRELAAVGGELAQAAFEMAQTQKNIGMATDADVQSAQTSALSAQEQIAMLDDTGTSLKQNICLMTGWNYDADMEIGSVPPPDLAEIDRMNPTEDFGKALACNYEIAAAKQSPFGRSDYDVKRTFRTWEELEERLRITLESLYQTVLESRAAYDAANTALQSARLVMDGNQRKYEMGMIGRLEYLQAQVAYLQQKMNADNASLALAQAMENYDWALEGIVTLE